MKYALLSVSDKTGITELGRFLVEHEFTILSTGGTARALRDAGIAVTPVSEFTGSPEILGGRVKTLTPRLFGGILYDRDSADHVRDSSEHDIPPIEVVAVNLYPFEQTIARDDVTLEEAIEQIDVGGPSMLRAAAKNHRHVVPLCTPALYEDFMTELASGAITDSFRRRAAIEVYRLTSDYDRAIVEYLAEVNAPENNPPESLTLRLDSVQSLRYGENPQQKAAFYRANDQRAFGWESGRSFEQLQGKELSYNNLIDLDAAWKIANAFDEPAAAVIKHTNPCGVGTADALVDALELAIEGDPVSAFGGIVATNRPFDRPSAQRVSEMFLEVIVAPSFSESALEVLSRKKNLRLIVTADLTQSYEVRSAAGGILIQTTDRILAPDDWKCVTKLQPSPDELLCLAFAWTVCAHVKSNAIVLTRGHQTIGIGAGQMSRVDAAKLAIAKSAHPTDGSFAASDAFFPFPDGLEVLADAGARAVIQPGGSVRDNEVIDAANRLGITMVFAGERHFRH